MIAKDSDRRPRHVNSHFFPPLAEEEIQLLLTLFVVSSASEILGQSLLAPYLGKISTESEIYGEMQQREDENQQVS